MLTQIDLGKASLPQSVDQSIVAKLLSEQICHQTFILSVQHRTRSSSHESIDESASVRL